MEIHNLMEDKVLQILHEVCDAEEKTPKNNYCTSEQCRLDAACYVLNRIPQRYVTSGRGFAYLESDFNDNFQLQVDIVALVHEGLRRVSSIRRNFYASPSEKDALSQIPSGIYFSFPLIKGRIINGINFEPVVGVDIHFKHEGQRLQMIDSRWPNPYSVVGNTPGTYLFWPRPIPAATVGEERLYEFEIYVEHQDFEPFRHYFTISIRSEELRLRSALKPSREFIVQDLFIIPKGIEEETPG